MTAILTSSLTERERAKLEKVLRKARRNLTTYKKLLWKRYHHAPHLDALDALLMQCSQHAESGGRVGIGHAIIEMPPRHGKTMTISRLYPTWHLGRNPDHRLLLASYGASLAQKNSRYARNIFEMSRFQSIFSQVQLDARSKAAEAWNLAPGAGLDCISWQWTDGETLDMTFDSVEGGADAMGVGGGITGKGGNIIIVDDPVKSREEAESATYRQKVWDWFTDDLYTRREPGAAVIVVMTRWHQDDLVGRLLREQPGKWTRLRMPARAEQDDPLERAIGAALWPERYPRAELANIEQVLGDYSFSALYQQRPVPAEGGLFKRNWFIPVVDVPAMQATVRFWDLAMSAKTTADYTVGVKIGLGTDWHYYVLDVARRQLDWGDVTGFLADTMLDDGPEVLQGIEEAGYMSRAVSDLNADYRLRQYAIYGYPVDKDKVTRALPVAAKFAAAQISPVQAFWNRDYIDELCSFPNGTHDDQVDATSGAWAMLDLRLNVGGELHYADDPGIGSGAY